MNTEIMLFEGELGVTEELDEDMPEKSQARQHRDQLHQLNERDWCSLQKVMDTLKKNFVRRRSTCSSPSGKASRWLCGRCSS